MTDSSPQLTVLMSVKNGEPYVHEAVASILGQTYSGFRFLILDNASRDNTSEIIKNFDDPRIDLVALPEDIGQTKALNRGLALIQTPFVARLDADDVARPRRLELQMAFMRDNPSVVLVGSAVQYIGPDGRPLYGRSFPTRRQRIIDDFCVENPFAHSAVMYRTETVRAAGGYPKDYIYAQDMALWQNLALRGDLANLDETLAEIRIHPNQAGHDPRLEATKRQEMVRLLENLLTFPDISPPARRAAEVFRAVNVARLGRRKEAAKSLLWNVVTHPLPTLGNAYLGRGFLGMIRARWFSMI